MRNCWNNVVLLVRSRWQMNLNKMCLNYNTTAMTWLVDLTPWHRKQVSSIESTVIWMLQYRLKICVQSMYMYKSKGQLNSEWSAITFLISPILEARAEILTIFRFIFWEVWGFHKFILNLTDLTPLTLIVFSSGFNFANVIFWRFTTKWTNVSRPAKLKIISLNRAEGMSKIRLLTDRFLLLFLQSLGGQLVFLHYTPGPCSDGPA